MRLFERSPRMMAVLTAALMLFAAPSPPAHAQTAAPPENLVNALGGLDTAPDLDVAALRQEVLDRIKAKAKADAAPLKRPPIAPQLLKLPQFSADIQFDADSPIIRPDSYRTLGRIADTLQDPALLAYGFLIVGHTESTGKRENNLTLSQRRADAVRDVLVTTFKVSSKRLQALGLGEEQLRDAARPAAPANQRIQVITIKTMP
jgi:outer membrane protein OmpA-like peptidoglycan-associated protein